MRRNACIATLVSVLILQCCADSGGPTTHDGDIPSAGGPSSGGSAEGGGGGGGTGEPSGGGGMSSEGGAVANGGCAGPNVMHCDDFERELDPTFWYVHDGASGDAIPTHEIDSMRAFRGSSSWHGSVEFTDGGSGFVELRESTFLPLPDLHTRVHVYVPASSQNTWFALGMIDDTSGGYASVGVGLDGGHLTLISWGGGQAEGADNDPFPVDTWVCLEWQYSGSDGTMTVWRDGQVVINAVPASYDGSVDENWVGIYGWNNPSQRIDVWLDDVAFGTGFIGCD
ncbi:MAG: hypothetical protein HOW73_18325 [Polyangiaceae bacterium]|nr:hypothetical protein [Polyangiaceae bacterium]